MVIAVDELDDFEALSASLLCSFYLNKIQDESF